MTVTPFREGSPRVVPATAFGRRFRSTTEARWATFFTKLGIAWEYEPETYDLGDEIGWYLPDFWLTDLGKYFEVKPAAAVDSDETKKARALAEFRGCDVLLAHGYGIPDPYLQPYIGQGQPGWIEEFSADSWDAPYAFTACRCGAIGVTFEARTDYLKNHRCPNGDGLADHRDCKFCPGKFAHHVDRLDRAYIAGASFRPDRR